MALKQRHLRLVEHLVQGSKVHELEDERHQARDGLHRCTQELHDVRMVQLPHELELGAELSLGHLVVVQVPVQLLHGHDRPSPPRLQHHPERTRANLRPLSQFLIRNLPRHQAGGEHGLGLARARAREVRLLERHQGFRRSVHDHPPRLHHHLHDVLVVSEHGPLKRRHQPAVEGIHVHPLLQEPVGDEHRPVARSDVKWCALIVVGVVLGLDGLTRFVQHHLQPTKVTHRRTEENLRREMPRVVLEELVRPRPVGVPILV